MMETIRSSETPALTRAKRHNIPEDGILQIWDRSVGVATGLWDARPDFDSRQMQDLPLLRSMQTGTGDHPASYLMGTEDIFSGKKAAEEWSWELPSHYWGQDFTNTGALPLLPTVIMSQSLIAYSRGRFYLLTDINMLCKIWGFHGGDYEEWCLLGCYAVWLL
jgi:hypothetical protein